VLQNNERVFSLIFKITVVDLAIDGVKVSDEILMPFFIFSIFSSPELKDQLVSYSDRLLSVRPSVCL
jgi:hypothetical protein